MDSITRGSSEFLIVDVADELDSLAALPVTTTYDVRDSANVLKINAAAAVVQGMLAKCLIDTSNIANWPVGRYKLYVRFPNLPETPLLGPLEFLVDA